MIRAERLNQISKLASEAGIVTIDALADELGVSKATVRRDINELCAEGIVEKTRGGIIFVDQNANIEPTYAMRFLTNTEEKQRIALAAREYITDGSYIMFDSGSTVLELAKVLPVMQHLSIVTYDLYIALELTSKEYVDLFMIGGMFRKRFFGFHGYFAENMIKELHANIAFIGADAVDLKNGIMGHNMNDVRLKQHMIDGSEKAILLCDHTKFETGAFIHISPLEKIDLIITGKETDEKYLRALRDMNIEVQIV